MRLPKVSGFYVKPEKKLNKSEIIVNTVDHFNKYKFTYISLGLFIGTQFIDPSSALAATGLDSAGNKIYGKLKSIGRWVILIVDGTKIIQSAIENDNINSRQTFFKFALLYMILAGWPKVFDIIDEVMNEI